jgi:hypothetical protein
VDRDGEGYGIANIDVSNTIHVMGKVEGRKKTERGADLVESVRRRIEIHEGGPDLKRISYDKAYLII